MKKKDIYCAGVDGGGVPEREGVRRQYCRAGGGYVRVVLRPTGRAGDREFHHPRHVDRRLRQLLAVASLSVSSPPTAGSTPGRRGPGAAQTV